MPLPVVLATFLLSTLALPLCSLALTRYVPKLIPCEPRLPRWWLCLGISLSFTGGICGSSFKLWYFFQGTWQNNIDSITLEWVVVGQLTQLFAILASLCHLKAAGSCVNSSLTKLDYAISASLVSAILLVIFLVT